MVYKKQQQFIIKVKHSAKTRAESSKQKARLKPTSKKYQHEPWNLERKLQPKLRLKVNFKLNLPAVDVVTTCETWEKIEKYEFSRSKQQKGM